MGGVEIRSGPDKGVGSLTQSSSSGVSAPGTVDSNRQSHAQAELSGVEE
jgi:hypothetical protein